MDDIASCLKKLSVWSFANGMLSYCKKKKINAHSAWDRRHQFPSHPWISFSRCKTISTKLLFYTVNNLKTNILLVAYDRKNTLARCYYKYIPSRKRKWKIRSVKVCKPERENMQVGGLTRIATFMYSAQKSAFSRCYIVRHFFWSSLNVLRKAVGKINWFLVFHYI